MSKFVRQHVAEREFEGDHVRVVLRGMKRHHAISISRFVHTEPDGTVKMIGEQEELLPELDAVLKDCVVSLEGLTDSEGNPVTIDDVLGEMYFMDLSSWILTELMNNSRVEEKGDDEKNSGAPQPAP